MSEAAHRILVVEDQRLIAADIAIRTVQRRQQQASPRPNIPWRPRGWPRRGRRRRRDGRHPGDSCRPCGSDRGGASGGACGHARASACVASEADAVMEGRDIGTVVAPGRRREGLSHR